jgi:DNA-binding NarL/FixJ family response regulator
MDKSIRVTHFRFGGNELVVVSEPIMRTSDFPDLNGAEREVALLAVSGYSNSDIAAKRCVRKQTVTNQLSSIYKKLGVASRSGMIAYIRDALAEPGGDKSSS